MPRKSAPIQGPLESLRGGPSSEVRAIRAFVRRRLSPRKEKIREWFGHEDEAHLSNSMNHISSALESLIYTEWCLQSCHHSKSNLCKTLQTFSRALRTNDRPTWRRFSKRFPEVLEIVFYKDSAQDEAIDWVLQNPQDHHTRPIHGPAHTELFAIDAGEPPYLKIEVPSWIDPFTMKHEVLRNISLALAKIATNKTKKGPTRAISREALNMHMKPTFLIFSGWRSAKPVLNLSDLQAHFDDFTHACWEIHTRAQKIFSQSFQIDALK